MQRVEVGELAQAEAAAGQVEPCKPDARNQHDRGQQPRLALVEQRGVGQCAGRDHAHDLARDGSLARGGVPDLLADRDRLAELQEARKVSLRRVHGHSGHRDRLARGLATARESDVDELRGAPRVVVEELVEVPHPVEQQVSGYRALMAKYCCMTGVWVLLIRVSLRQRRALGLVGLYENPLRLSHQAWRLRSPYPQPSLRISSASRSTSVAQDGWLCRSSGPRV